MPTWPTGNATNLNNPRQGGFGTTYSTPQNWGAPQAGNTQLGAHPSGVDMSGIAFPKIGTTGNWLYAPPAKAPTGGTGAPKPPAGPGGPATPGGPSGPSAGPTQIQTSITPGQIYNPAQTQIAQNQAIANSAVDLDSAMKRFMTPGSSRSASTVSNALPEYARGLMDAAGSAAMIPLQDRLANIDFQRQGETARENEFLGLASQDLTRQEQDQWARLVLLQPTLSLAQRMLGTNLF